MTIAELNSRYGAPGRIVFREGFAGYPNVVLANRYGVAEVALLGGTVLSYRPTGHSPVIFRPAKTNYNRGDAFHGGIPVCWPQFGNRLMPELLKHGFARKLIFEVRGSEYSEEMTEIDLGISSNAETLKLWPYDFDLTLKLTVSMKLTLNLITKNTGNTPFAFSCAFHPYLLVRDRDATTLRGLDGTTFVNAATGEAGVPQHGDLSLACETDHVFSLPPAPRHEFALLDPGLRRALAVVSSGNTKAVVWNPGAEAKIDDLAADDWKKFVCVEPVSDWPSGGTLAPGATHELLTAIQSVLDI